MPPRKENKAGLCRLNAEQRVGGMEALRTSCSIFGATPHRGRRHRVVLVVEPWCSRRWWWYRWTTEDKER